MRRSEINEIIQRSRQFLRDRCFHLPPFEAWSPEDWLRRRREVGMLVERRLGWDVTDFGLGDFAARGLVLFALRNGAAGAGQGADYAEKILIVRTGQVTPLHFHWSKTEDIINRGGGRLAIRVFRSTGTEGLSKEAVSLRVDGMLRTVEAGGVILLDPGSSITLPPKLYHSFWAVGDPVLLGEVSSFNDDDHDNRFFARVGRHPEIVEDESPCWLLVSDYEKSLML